jgi:hypothetical protein
MDALGVLLLERHTVINIVITTESLVVVLVLLKVFNLLPT